MSAPVADPRNVEAYARQLVAKAGDGARVMALAADPVYRGPGAVDVDGITVVVRGCPSALAVWEAVTTLPPGGYAVLLTDRSASDLGDSLMTRLYRQRLEPLDPWAPVPGMFACRHLEAGLRHAMPWLPDLLSQRAPADGYPPSPTDEVTADHLLGCLAQAVLGVPAHEIATDPLLEAFASLRVRQSWAELPEAARSALAGWVELRADPAAAGVLAIAGLPRTQEVDPTSLGLVLDVLYGADGPTLDVRQARRAWEQGYELPRIPASAAASIGAFARARVKRLGEQDVAAREPVWRDTPKAFQIAGFPDGICLSPSHPDGFTARLEALAAGINAGLRSGPSPEAALQDLRAHDLAVSDRSDETERATMAVRLIRWLAGDTDDAPTTLAAALRRQSAVDGWVDRAVADVWSGTVNPQAAAAYRALCDRVLAVRREHDRQFAALLASTTASRTLPPDVLPVEDVLARVVDPLRRCAPVLLLVIDGMSTAVAAAVADGISRSAWQEYLPDGASARQSVLAALPTMTRYSRTSLLTGVLREGSQTDEKREFPKLTGGPVFHKDDLRSHAGAAVNPDVQHAVQSAAPVVGVVLNTVDDTLAKHDPDGTRWDVAAIQHLPALLSLAREAGRIVVLTSDHGHVVERGGRAESRDVADVRWRAAASGPAGPQEVRLTGQRVLPAGGDVVAPWVEDLRYGRKAAGYHGGASAAEVTIPLLVFARPGTDLGPAGWVPAGDQAPPWWDRATGRKSAAPVTAPPEETLFELPADPWLAPITSFLASPVYARSRAMALRGAPTDQVVAQVLRVLLEGGGRATDEQVARVLGTDPVRLRGVMSGLRRLLNVEGYAVLSQDADGRTVLLNIPLWRQQFGVG